ncbi:SDR family NAD(P)-dependent oxidoreductase [Herbiconiux daphne]|uniref:SDR family NAD(P)-dependent oxidoreductase n=1 Tax=Herbiconiux daphne TaxID=2970914 RepID=A0ABT2GWF2_9MICO|nr:SDR family NAD(P)-dependent oxidoreductase [Herbiconiux daphne]MCS5732294.1 SDR family NAD(P)-dependent oxidoreductase [Herbiconiux daphne]
MSTWFITGASRGFGAELTRAALDRGHQVIATARNAQQVRDRFPDAGENLLPVSLDVTDADQIDAAVAAAVAAFGTIDVLINNAGRGLLGAVEEATDADIRSIYEVNVFAPLAIARAVLPVMREKARGTVVNISSVGGFASAVGFGVYCSTKFALEGYTEALRDELAPLGITAGIVEPGYFRTDFLDGSSLAVSAGISDYESGPVGDVRTMAAGANHNQPGDPVKGAEAIVDAVDRGGFPARLFLGSDTLAAVGAKADEVRAELDRQRVSAAATDLA